MDVAGAHVAAELGLPELLHDLLAREDLARVLDEQPQDLELRARQVDRLAPDGDEVPRQVDRDGARLDRLPVGPVAAVELAPAQLGAHPAEQLADRERLRHVVVGADLEAHDLVHLGVLGGQQDDRHGALGADLAADVEAALAGHHDVQDQEVEDAVVVDLLLGVLAVGGEGDVEALLLERIARPTRGRTARRRRRGCGPGLEAWGSSRHATGVAVGWCSRSFTQNVVPLPGSESRPISPPITSTIRLAIERPRPNPSLSSAPLPR